MIAPKVITMPLPHGRDWLYYPDLNIVALAPHLDQVGRERAIDEFHAEWRRSVRRRLRLGHYPGPPMHLTARRPQESASLV